MDRCDEIVANVRMEERYAGLSLVFEQNRNDLKEEIDQAIRRVCEITKLEPLVFDNKSTDKDGHEAFYVEFTDETQRESGAFFTQVLQELGIDHCANDVVSQEDAKC